MQIIRPSGLSNDALLAQYRSALQTKQEIQDAVQTGERIVLDLSDAEWFTPTFLVPISVVYTQLVSAGTDIRIRYPSDSGIKSYLDQIGFPEGYERPPEEYENHLPLCLINTDLEEDAFEVVGEKVRNLVKEFLGQNSFDQFNWLTYPMSEIIDNADQHSMCNFGSLLVQNYPSKEALDICIADDGISIPGSYERNNLDFKDDEEALRMAMVEGRSTRPDEGYERGYGLRTTVKMICEGLEGQVMLSSREATLFRARRRRPGSRLGDKKWGGTVFAARLNLPQDDFDYLDYLTA